MIMITRIGFLCSCSTRDIFRTHHNVKYSDEFEIVFQQQRVTLISLMQDPVPFTIESTRRIENGEERVLCSEWIRADLSKSLFNELKKGIDYLLIDMFYDAFFGVIIYDDTIITNNKWDSHFTKFYLNIKNKEILTMFNNHDKYFELWKENCDKFFEYMKKEFPETKIVLNKIRGANKVLKTDKSYYISSSYSERTEKLNNVLEELEQYIIDNYDVKVINCLEFAIADEEHIRGEYFINYIQEYYHLAYRQLKDILIQDKIDTIEGLNKKVEYMSKEIELLSGENQKFIKKYEKLKEEKTSSNPMKIYSSLKKAKVGFSKVLIPEGYKIHKSAPNGILLSNGESYIGLYEAPRNNTFNQLVKKWNEKYGHTETKTFILNDTTFESVEVEFEQNKLRETYFKKEGINYHIYERGIEDKNAFNILFNSLTLNFDYSLWSKIKKIPQLSQTSFGYSTQNGKIRYHNWIQAFANSTLIEDLNDFCEREWFTRYLNNKFPNEDFKINFFGAYGLHHTLKWPMDGKKVFYSLEDLNYRFLDMKNNFGTYALDYVDLSMGYDLIDHEKYFRFPYWACAHFSPEVTEEEIENTIDKWHSASYKKTRDVVNISSHDRWNTRKKISDDIKKIAEISYGGKWRNNTDELWIKYNNNKEKFMNQFKFNLCPENLNADGYVTEKIFDSIRSDCIPLYLGGGNYLEPKILNQDAILRWYIEDTIDNTDTIELFKNIYYDEKTYKEFKEQDILKESSKKYIIKIFSDLEKQFERVIYD